MSTKQAGVLPEPSAAYQHLFDNIHAKAFLGTLARRGYEPLNEKEAQDLFMLAGTLRNLPKQSEKTASSRFGGAVEVLEGYMAQAGIPSPGQNARAQETEMSIKQAAANLMEDATIYNSVLSLKQAEAEQLAAQAG